MKNLLSLFKFNTSEDDESTEIKFRTSKTNQNDVLLYGGMIVVKIKDKELIIDVSEQGLDKLSKCSKPNDAIKLLKKASKKEAFELIETTSFNDEPICSAITEGAFRVLSKACMTRYTQLYLREQ